MDIDGNVFIVESIKRQHVSLPTAEIPFLPSSFHSPLKRPAGGRSGYDGTSRHCPVIFLSFRIFLPFCERVQIYG